MRQKTVTYNAPTIGSKGLHDAIGQVSDLVGYENLYNKIERKISRISKNYRNIDYSQE